VPVVQFDGRRATAEISRAQVWQWIRNQRGVLDDGRKITSEMFRRILDEEIAKVKHSSTNKFAAARRLFDRITTEDDFAES
jgi:malate synthase